MNKFIKRSICIKVIIHNTTGLDCYLLMMTCFQYFFIFPVWIFVNTDVTLIVFTLRVFFSERYSWRLYLPNLGPISVHCEHYFLDSQSVYDIKQIVEYWYLETKCMQNAV